jgi:HK97 family phage portal protein
MQTSAVYAAVRVIAESVASLPLLVYRRLDSGGKERAQNNANYRLLHDRPNSWQTAFEFWEMITSMVCLRGNAYLFKVKNGVGQVRELLPLQIDRVSVEQNTDWSLTYWITGEAGKPIGKYGTSDVLHIRGLSLDGIMGISPIAYHRNAIGLSIEAENYGSRYFKNNARPSGVLEHPRVLGDEASRRLREHWNKTYGGRNQGSTAILEEGMQFKPVSMSNEDGQFLETRQFQIEEIARIFRVPSVLLQHADKTSTYASSEQFFLSFTKYTLMPWLRRIESAVNRDLFSPGSQYFAEFLVDALERADAKTRAEFYASALQNEWMNRNEVRERENLNRIAGGDEFRNPAINPQEGNSNANS